MATTQAHRLPHGERLTFTEVADRYIAHVEMKGRKPSTLAGVRDHMDHWLIPTFGSLPPDAISHHAVNDLVTAMRAGRRPKLTRTKPLSDKTIVNVIGTMGAALAFAERKGWASDNPVRRADLPEPTPASEDIRFLDPNEVSMVVSSTVDGAYQQIDRAIILAAALTGLRQGELVALRWKDIDWAVARVRVRQNYVLGEFGTPKSRRSTRSVPMADAVGRELDRFSRALGTEPSPDALVFSDPLTGGPLANRAILLRFRKALAAAGLDESHRFHDLRHAFGTRMASVGVPMRTLQEWMGHRDISTTQRYADYAPSTHEAALVEAAFGKPGTARDEVRV